MIESYIVSAAILYHGIRLISIHSFRSLLPRARASCRRRALLSASSTAAAAELRDEALSATKRLEDEASSLRSTNTERGQQLVEKATLLKFAVDAQERVRAAANALDQERAAADALEQQAAALRARVRTEHQDNDAAADGTSSEAEAIARLHSQAAAVQNIKNLIPMCTTR